jgi:hypothetical protein
VRRDYTAEASALFARFAERHSLHFEIDHDAPIELLWTFPVQPGLLRPLTLGLQNRDELNFGVEDFWSYFFPFQKAAARFEQIIDAWLKSQARILVTGRRGRVLELLEDGEWVAVYRANRILPFKGLPRAILSNLPAEDETT